MASSQSVKSIVALVAAFALGAVSASLLANKTSSKAVESGSDKHGGDRPVKNGACGNADKSSQQQRIDKRNNDINDDNPSQSIDLHYIGKIKSVYRLCVGTPRQGLLVPNSRGRIELHPSLLSSDSILGLENFSHVWIVFIFHLNTNSKIVQASKKSKSGSRQFPSKISPPALGGKKVGLFSTRTPHRPNPIGLTLCKIESIHVSRGKDKSQPFYVNVSGLDLVDGTPIVDIKPFVPHYDTVINPDDIGGPNCIPDGVSLPHWVGSGLEQRRNVTFTDAALEQLGDIVSNNPKALEFYGPHTGRDKTTEAGMDAMKGCISQVLAVDVRSKWQTGKARKGKFQAERAGRVKDAMGNNSTAGASTTTKAEEVELCTQQLDNLLVKYSVSAPDNQRENTVVMGSGANDNVLVQAIQLLGKDMNTSSRGNGAAKQSGAESIGVSDDIDAQKMPIQSSEKGEMGKQDDMSTPKKNVQEFGALKQYWAERGATNTPSGLTPSNSTETLDCKQGKVISFSNRRVITPPRVGARKVISKNTPSPPHQNTNIGEKHNAKLIVSAGQAADKSVALAAEGGAVATSNEEDNV